MIFLSALKATFHFTNEDLRKLMCNGGAKRIGENIFIDDTETGGGSGRAGGGAQSGTGTDNRKTVDRSWIWAAVLSVWETIKNVRNMVAYG